MNKPGREGRTWDDLKTEQRLEGARFRHTCSDWSVARRVPLLSCELREGEARTS